MHGSVDRRVLLKSLGATLTTAILATLLPSGASAQPPSEEPDDQANADVQLTKPLQDACRKQLEGYEFFDGSQKLEAKFVSVMTWTNPAREGVQRGVVGVWTVAGRPFAIGTVFCHPLENNAEKFRFNHELHTLREKAFTADTVKGTMWKPPASGFMLKAIEGAEVPAESPAARLRQMRAIAERFTASAVSDKEQKSQLRLLAKPLYRYESTTGDGALFTFMADAGTDPEVILAIECDRTGREGSWKFGCARYSDMKLFVQLDGRDAWAFADGAKGPWHKAGINDALRFYTAVELPLASIGKP